MVKVNKLLSLLSQNFLKEIENMFYVFLSSYRNTHESFGALKKTVVILLVCQLVLPQLSMFSQTSHCISTTQQKQGTGFPFLN